MLTHQPIPPHKSENAPIVVTVSISIHGEKIPMITQTTPAMTILSHQDDFIKKNHKFSKILTGKK